MKKRGVLHYVITILENLLVKAASSIISILVAFAGYYIFINQKSPLNLIFGLPLVLIGVGLTINFFWTIILVIFSPKYNRGVCKLCASNPVAKLTNRR